MIKCININCKWDDAECKFKSVFFFALFYFILFYFVLFLVYHNKNNVVVAN